MSILTPGGLPEEDRQGHPIYPSLSNMIRLETVMDDEDLNDTQKLRQGLGLLYGDDIPPDWRQALGELMWFYSGGEDAAGSGGRAAPSKSARLYDFEQDAGCLYAAFRQAYQLDISCDGPNLHWWEFRALFFNLPGDTEMAQRIYYRGVDTRELKGRQRKEAEAKKAAVALKRKRPVERTLAQINDGSRGRVRQRFEEAQHALERKQKDGE